MFSMARWLNAQAHPADKQAQRDADDELQQVTRSERGGGYIIPSEAVRDISTATGEGDGVVQEDHFASHFVESLISMNHAYDAATVYSGLKDKTQLPAEDTISSVDWVSENAAPSESDPTARQITLTPHRLTTFVDMSRRLLVMGLPSAEDLVWHLLTRRVARAIDSAILFGTGANTPTGMASLTGKNADITLTTANSKKGTNIWAALGSAESVLAQNNIDEGSIMALMSPAFYYNCRFQAYDGSGTRTTADSKMAILPEMDSMLLEQYPQKKTGAITTAQGMFLADFSEVVVGQFSGGFEVALNPYILDREGLIRITITSLCDIQFKHAKAFQQITVS